MSSLVTVRQGHLLYRLYLGILSQGRETLNESLTTSKGSQR